MRQQPFIRLAGFLACVLSLTVFAQERPNILLLVAEDLSPRIGAFGDPLAATPNIDELARAGVRYTNTFTAAGVCAPSRAALITGLHQISFGGHHMRTWNGPEGRYYAMPPRGHRAFPEILRANGYFTFTDTKLDYQFSEVRAGTGPFTIWDREGPDHGGWRDREAGQPFFGLINFLHTHESGIMRMDVEPYSRVHAGTQQMRRNGNLVAPTVTDPARVGLPPYYADLPEVRADIARHYDNIANMDRRVGEVLAALREDGLVDNTIVIWTTDHGDGLPRAKRELFDAGIHVPMILHVPEPLRQRDRLLRHLNAGVDERLVSFVDLAPTILQMAGVKRPAGLHGVSFITGQRDVVLASRDRIDEVIDRQRALRDKSFKYIRSWRPDVPGGHPLAYRDNLDSVRALRAAFEAGELDAAQRTWFEPAGEEQLYDLASDPHEIRNLAGSPEHRAVLDRMRRKLASRLERIGDLGEVEERELRGRMLSGGEVPQTPAPDARYTGNLVQLVSDVDASIGYRYPGEKHWRLYTAPVPRARMEVKAVRYGWRESPAQVVD